MRVHTRDDPRRTAAVLAGLRRYQEAERVPLPAPAPIIAARHGAVLRDFGGSGPDLLFVPSLINPPRVLDLGSRSLLRWIAARERRVLLVDWGEPDPANPRSVSACVEDLLMPLIASLSAPPDVAGYCLGGTMALAAAHAGAARSLALIAAPWHFDAFAGAERERLAALWRQARPVAQRLGMLPTEVLQSAFWTLDPARTVTKYEQLATADDAGLARFVELEDWANDGAPLSFAAARELFEDFFAADLPGTGTWSMGGAAINPAALPCPVLNVTSTSDRIVPAASAARVGEPLALDLGHVGMVVGSRAEAELWRPLAGWLSRVSPS